MNTKWSELTIGSVSGHFTITKIGDRKVAAALSYENVDNVQVLEAAMRLFWKGASDRLSDLLTRDK